MINIEWKDLPKLGLNPLTGEADGYCFGRILCDLNDQGVTLFKTYHGLPESARLLDNWNSRVGDYDAVASIMMTREAIWKMATFGLLHLGCDYVVDTTHQLVGLYEGDEYTARYLKMCGTENSPYHLYRNVAKTSTQPRVGDRNIHAFTGRTL